ncbi:MAG: hypothetical protein U0L36_01015 [Acutalibacteraceae bacterium]|nr:hypothetical protein [Acutalibacteraceae bacterium]
MKYRQWKKNFKKAHGRNPTIEEDKRKAEKWKKKQLREAAETFDIAEFNKAVKQMAVGVGMTLAAWAEAISESARVMAEAFRGFAERVKEEQEHGRQD